MSAAPLPVSPSGAPGAPEPQPRSPGVTGFLHRAFVCGPDPVEPDEPPRFLETLLPWPVRCAVVAAVVLSAAWWRDTGVGQQVAWGLHVGALSAVAIIASLWWQILVTDCIVAGLWFLPFKPPRGRRFRWNTLHIVTYVNRQVGHIAALVVWLLLSLGMSISLPRQLGGVAAVTLLGLPLLNGIARSELSFLGQDRPSKATGDLLWRRRVLIYLVTALGLVLLSLSAPSQVLELAPLLVAVSGGTVLRVIRHEIRHRVVRRTRAEEASEKADIAKDAGLALDARQLFREKQNNAARRTDGFGPALVLAALVALVVASYWLRSSLDAELRAALDGPEAPGDTCSREPHAPLEPEVGVFLMADPQTHELAGARFPGQTEVAEAFVKSATRPVSLAMLTSVPYRQLAGVYRGLADAWMKATTARAAREAPATAPVNRMLWAHLGDLADIACQGELERALSSLDLFGTADLAGITMGNHESNFIGSFHWSPYWDGACSSGRLDKDQASASLVRHFRTPEGDGAGEFLNLRTSRLSRRGGSLSAVTPLGVTRQPGANGSAPRLRGGIGVFLDSSDGRAFDWGQPGSIGSVSREQLDLLSAAIGRLRSRGGPYADPVYVLFEHAPYGDLEGASRARVGEFVVSLDDRRDAPEREPRVLAIVSAHEHVAGTRRHCIGSSDAGKRLVREFLIGSTTDLPQQAAVVEVGPNDRGVLALSVRTLQTVARAGAACGSVPGIVGAMECRQVAARLSAEPACRPLLQTDPDAAPPRDCQELERSTSFMEQLGALRTFTGPRDPKEKKRLERVEARELLDCLCRSGACGAGEATDPLEDGGYLKRVEQASAVPARAQELACLAWAAGARQTHKSQAPTMGEALRCAFDDPTLPAERVSTVSLETVTCY